MFYFGSTSIKDSIMNKTCPVIVSVCHHARYIGVWDSIIVVHCYNRPITKVT